MALRRLVFGGSQMFGGRKSINTGGVNKGDLSSASFSAEGQGVDALRDAYYPPNSFKKLLGELHWLPREQDRLWRVLGDPPASFSAQALAEYSEKKALAEMLAGLIAKVPNGKAVETFGAVPAVWAALTLRRFDSGAANKLMEDVAKSRGVDRVVAARAFSASERGSIKNADLILRALNLLDSQDSFLQSLDLPDLIAKNWKGAPLKRDVLERYSLNSFRTRDCYSPSGPEIHWGCKVKTEAAGRGVHIYDVYLDSPISMGLFYMNEPNAILSSHISERGGLFISQIQGLRAVRKEPDGTDISCNSWGLSKLDWVPLMVEVLAHEARAAGFGSLTIQGAVNNLWVHEKWRVGPLMGQPKLPVEAARRRYDDNAERLGFVYAPSGDWVMDLA